jgi:ribosomal protein L13E
MTETDIQMPKQNLCQNIQKKPKKNLKTDINCPINKYHKKIRACESFSVNREIAGLL